MASWKNNAEPFFEDIFKLSGSFEVRDTGFQCLQPSKSSVLSQIWPVALDKYFVNEQMNE